jgi:hypothetical protein
VAQVVVAMVPTQQLEGLRLLTQVAVVAVVTKLVLVAQVVQELLLLDTQQHKEK